MNKLKKDPQDNLIKSKLNFLDSTKLKNAINKVISREMSDNEYMKDKTIMFTSKINQIVYFCKDKKYRNELMQVQNNETELIKFLEKYDYELFPDEWQNETIRLKTSIVGNLKSNTTIPCIKCGRKNVYTISKQIRSGDEGTTNFYTCLTCNHTWSDE